MCGIAGFIGESKAPDVTFALISSIFSELETRGTDASGFWGTVKEDDRILYHKEPTKASMFAKSAVWKGVEKHNPNLLLIHARAASVGIGSPIHNRNNHPFVSTDRSIGLIHNGRIPDAEYDALKKKYEVLGDCDSEMFLRIFEAGKESDNKEDQLKAVIDHRLNGIRDIWSQIVRGHMAVAIGEQLQKGQRRLWLFRNQHRTIWVIDLRKYLGQVFFCSTPEIWSVAVKKCAKAEPLAKRKIKLIELPTEEIWSLSISPDHPVVDESCIRKFDVCPGSFSSCEFKDEKIKVAVAKPTCQIIGHLDDNEEVVGAKIIRPQVVPFKESRGIPGYPYPRNFQGRLPNGITRVETPEEYRQWTQKTVTQQTNPVEPVGTVADVVEETDGGVAEINDNLAQICLQDILQECENIRSLVTEIETTAQNKRMEGSLIDMEMAELKTAMETARLDLQGTLKLLEH